MQVLRWPDPHNDLVRWFLLHLDFHVRGTWPALHWRSSYCQTSHAQFRYGSVVFSEYTYSNPYVHNCPTFTFQPQSAAQSSPGVLLLLRMSIRAFPTSSSTQSTHSKHETVISNSFEFHLFSCYTSLVCSSKPKYNHIQPYSCFWKPSRYCCGD